MQNTEIEHKYLLADHSYRQMASHVYTIRQGYLSTDPKRVVRIRQKDDKAFITIKSLTDPVTLARFEWEHEITTKDADALFPLCVPYIINKQRYIVKWENLIIEIDEFHGANEGLIMAEVELQSPDQQFTLPSFIGKEVSDDPRYYNQYLSEHPYSTWK